MGNSPDEVKDSCCETCADTNRMVAEMFAMVQSLMSNPMARAMMGNGVVGKVAAKRMERISGETR